MFKKDMKTAMLSIGSEAAKSLWRFSNEDGCFADSVLLLSELLSLCRNILRTMDGREQQIIIAVYNS